MTVGSTTFRRSAGILSAGVLALGLAACGPEAEDEDETGDDATAEPGGDDEGDEAAGNALDVEAYDEVIARGPVADDAVVEANEWASAIREAGTLQRGGTETSELFSLVNPSDGVDRGFDAGLSQLLAQYILGDVDAELIQVTTDTREDLLVNASVDVIFATYSITPERAERIDFAGPYYVSQTGVLVQADNDEITGVDDLDSPDVTVATQAASTGVTILEEFAPEANVLELPDHAQALAAVQQGRADAYVIDQGLLLNAVVSNDDVKIVGEPFGPGDYYGIGLPPDSDAKEFVNEWLQVVIDEGLWEELWRVSIGDRTGVDEVPAPPEIGSVEGS